MCFQSGLSQIALAIGRNKSTVSREISRNTGGRGYRFKQAVEKAKARRSKERSSGKAGRGCIPDRVYITARPLVVEAKSRIGDREGDTIISAKHKGAFVSYVDRLSKFTLLKKIDRKMADLVTQATIEKMANLPHPVRTITYDNGKEFSAHKDIATALNTSCYFATPYHSWERRLNEHTNGLVRQYLPKST